MSLCTIKSTFEEIIVNSRSLTIYTERVKTDIFVINYLTREIITYNHLPVLQIRTKHFAGGGRLHHAEHYPVVTVNFKDDLTVE